MTGVNKLQLVDVGKLNAILEMFKKENETKKIFDSIKNPDVFSIEEKKTNMEKIDDRQGENIVEFLKKKNSIKREYDLQEKKEKENEEFEEKKKRKRIETAVSSVQQQYSEQLSDYFEKKKFRVNSAGKIKIGNVSVNEKDLIYDFTHQAVKDTSFNLSPEQRLNVLKELKKTGMPASNIRNTTLKKIYVIGKSSWGEASFFPTSEEDTEELQGLFKKKKSSLNYDRVIGRGRVKK